MVDDIFPQLRATARANTYFADFNDSDNRFKFFEMDNAPSLDSPYITAEFAPAAWNQNSGWTRPVVTLTAWGPDTSIPKLWEIIRKLTEIYTGTDWLLAAGDGYPALQYALIGEPVYDRDKNPVTDERAISVALPFGIET